MTTIVTRAGKGSPLTNVEVDANFTNLNNDKLEKTGGTITANSSSAALTITQTGTGSAFVVEDQSGDTTPFVISSDGGVSIGTTAAAGTNTLRVVNTLLATDRLEINSQGTGDRFAYIDLIGDDTYADYGARLIRDNNGANAATQLITRGTGDLTIKTTEAGAISLATSSVERMRIDASGNVLVKSAAGLGYGTGAGGTVTQATSKSTAVTLNKPCGQITMNNEALAAGASVYFTLNNSLCSANDAVISSIQWGGGIGTPDSYSVESMPGGSQVRFRVINLSAGSLSESIVINFAIIKGSVS